MQVVGLAALAALPAQAVAPLRVQAVLLDVTSAFLSSLEQSGAEGGAAARSPAEPLPPQRRLQEGIKAYVLDPAAARLWRSEL